MPAPLFDVPYSTVLLDREEQIIGLTVAKDEQLRFPEIKSLPLKYVTAVTYFEDKRFWKHWGVDIRALCRAMRQNWKAGKVVSGGSTLSMQVIRLSRNNPPRTIGEKIFEMLLALRLEMSYSKEEILCMYASHAPFGGNIAGIQAAALKYFDRKPDELSWAEATLLAVLPNAPSLRNTELLFEKRNRLLEKLYRNGEIKEDDYRLALLEPQPKRLQTEKSIAPHLLGQAQIRRNGEICRSFIDARLQNRLNEIVSRHSYMLSANHIYNASVLVAHIPTGEVRGYVGNTPALTGSRGNDVDIIQSVRSSGSILKPALYALMQQDGKILPATLLADIPSRFGNYAPSNFNKTFQGAVPAHRALSMSLNIPFVRLLRDYDYHRFYDDLKLLGIHSLNRPADGYGLSLILGGAETSLWDVCNMYAGKVSVLRHYNEHDGTYFSGEYERLRLWQDEEKSEQTPLSEDKAPLKASAIWLTLKALLEVERPDMETGWKKFASRRGLVHNAHNALSHNALSQEVLSQNALSWKTGTSFGFRDGWAIGVTAEWVVGVWVGNADGEGRPGLTGIRTAAPILFEVVGTLPFTSEYPVEARDSASLPIAMFEPIDEMVNTTVCRHSGCRASAICPETDAVWVCERGSRTEICPYHQLLHLDKSGKWRVSSECESVYNMQIQPWFVLPPVQEWYYSRVNPTYRRLPPFRADCTAGADSRVSPMEMIYPRRGTKVFIPRDFGGEKGRVVFDLAHHAPQTEVFWHIDENYMGMTKDVHQLAFDIPRGWHELHIFDSDGNTLRQRFRVE
ncbi:penicillin-binding protein 1C [Bacteroidia bacterium]|nr:penicillin-binding protein 1C [Bacteroidia bacterium]